MSTRTRARPTNKSYTARLRQRGAAPRPARTWPSLLTSRYLPASLAVTAEVGQLIAALVEWPAAPIRGVVHVVAAAVLGVLAATIYCGPNRVALVAGIGLGAALPIGWLAGALAGLPLYQDFPLLAGIGVSAVEITMAGLLVILWHSATPQPRR